MLKLASEKSQNKEDNSLTSAYAAMSTSSHYQSSDNLVPTLANTNGGYRFPRSEFSIPSECIPHIDVIPDNIKKRIWEGKDMNLTTLLIPRHDNNINTNHDQAQTKGVIICQFEFTGRLSSA